MRIIAIRTEYAFSGVCQLLPVLKQEARELVPE